MPNDSRREEDGAGENVRVGRRGLRPFVGHDIPLESRCIRKHARVCWSKHAPQCTGPRDFTLTLLVILIFHLLIPFFFLLRDMPIALLFWTTAILR